MANQLRSVGQTALRAAARESNQDDVATRLVPSGIPALDARIGGLVRGRYYLLNGAPGAGKTTAALQFIGHALSTGERVLILTQDDPADLLAQADFLGFEFGLAAEQDQLAVLQFRIDFARNYSRAPDPTLALDELKKHIAAHGPDRVVIDSLSPFMEESHGSDDALAGFPAFLDSLSCTTYLLFPGEFESVSARIYDRVISSAAGIFHFSIGEGQGRSLTIQKLRQPVLSTEPLRFVVKAGCGVVEREPRRYADEISEISSRRVILLRGSTELPEEFILALEERYELVVFQTVESALGELVRGEHGAVIVSMNAEVPERAFSLVREIRRAGNGAPILYLSPHVGLRGSTRARGLQAGGDDFLTEGLSPEEFLSRIETARRRGHHRTADVEFDVEPLFLQPVDESGESLLLDLQEFRRVVRLKLASNSHPFFALLALRADGMSQTAAWPMLAGSLRIKEGDLIAGMPDDGLVIYLHDVRRRHVDTLLARITAAYRDLGSFPDIQVYRYPADAAEVRSWLGMPEAPAQGDR
jgi:KaiC/GvpD/RAD55 family RecA-like ATPase/DNA-binding response OmpR family regulator